MMKNLFHKKSSKGYLLAGMAALSVSNVYIFSKAALLVTPLLTFGFYWCLMACSYNLALITSTGKIKLLFSYPNKTLKNIAIIGFFELTAAVIFFMAIRQVDNPSIVSFLINTTPVFVILMSIPLLNEKFNKAEVLGVLITLAGAFMLSYSGKFSFTELFVKGANLSILASIVAAIGLVIAKKNIKNIDPYVLSFTRTFFLFVFYLMAAIVMHSSFEVSNKALINMAIGSFCGPFLGAILQYNAFKYIDVSKESLIQNSNGFFVIITSYLYLGIYPIAIQIIGGIITITGVAIMVMGKFYTKDKNL